MGIFAKGSQFPANVEADTPQNRYGGQFTKDSAAGEALGEVISDVNSKADSANTTAGAVSEDLDTLEGRVDVLEQGGSLPHQHPSADITGTASTVGISAAKGAVVKGDTINGMIKVVSASITDVAHIVNKDYVDKGLETKAPSSHTHPAGDITGSASTLGLSASKGAVVKGGTVDGMLKVMSDSITDVAHIVNKDYVDKGLETKAPSSHSHSWNEVTGKPSTFTPSSHTHAWDDVTGKPTTFTPSSHTHPASDITGSASTLGLSAAKDAVVKTDTINGMLKVVTASITDVSHVVNKDYVDQGLETKAPSSHSHSWADVSGKPSTFTPSSHTHGPGDITGSASSLGIAAAKGAVVKGDTVNGMLKVVTDSITDVAHVVNKDYVDQGLETRAPSSHSHSWNEVTGKPSTFTPSSHTHSSADITGSASTLGIQAAEGAVVKGGTIDGMLKVVSSSITDVAHIVNKDYVDKGLETKAPSSHSHSWNEVTGKPSTFTPSSHTHSWTQVTGKPTTFTPSSHTHTWAQVTGKPSTFTPSSHTHSSADITGSASTLGISAAKGAVVKGDTVNGMLKVVSASITDVAHVVNKDYVDKGVTRWERWSGRGEPPASLNPVSGQVMVNLSTGQVWKI